MAELHAGATSVCGVGRRHGLSPSQLFPGDVRLGFCLLPLLGCSSRLASDRDVREDPRPVRWRANQNDSTAQSGIIEVEIDGLLVRVSPGAEAELIVAVLYALKSIS